MALPTKGQLNTFVDRLLAFVPEDKRGEARSIYSQLSDAAGELDLERARLVDVGTKQTDWWNKNQNAVEERDRLRAELAARPAGGGGMDENAIQKSINDAVAEASARTLETGLGLITVTSNIATGHLKEFGETIDTVKLAKDAIAAGQPIDQFYHQSVAQRRQERDTAARTAELQKARDEGAAAGRQEVLNQLPGKGLPFPSPNASGPTTLAGLKKPEAGAANPYSLDAAVQIANEVMARQNQ